MNDLATFLSWWSFAPVPMIAIGAAALAYGTGVRRINQRFPNAPWPRRQSWCFGTGLALLWVVIIGPVGAADDTYFWAHMVQHIVIMMLAAPLLLLGNPVLLVLRTASHEQRHRVIVPFLRSRFVRAISNPVFGWLLFAGVLVGTHFSPFFDFALRHPLVHDYVEHTLYLTAALIYYLPLLGWGTYTPVRPALRVVSLFAMMIPETMVGFFIYSANFLLYPFYTHVSRPFGPGPMVDQQLAGALMWGGSMLIDSVWVTIAVLEWLHSEERRSRRLDLDTLAVPRQPLQAP